MNSKYVVIGIMSGTSLDGVDLACCEFDFNQQWSFRLLAAKTVKYDAAWKKRLVNLMNASAVEISKIDCSYGDYLGRLVKKFCSDYRINPDFVSSHGHTVFHQPHSRFTRQIGSGAHIAAGSNLPVVCDFRSVDVALGGQGAPLVPIGDKLLFPGLDFCLNLGGIANISYDESKSRKAYDICACNLVLNHFAMKRGKAFDKDGNLASSGEINHALLKSLERIRYYSKPFPKSLGREDIMREVFPVISKFKLRVEDVLATFSEHIALQVAAAVDSGNRPKRMLVTGGGALNLFLMERIIRLSKAEVVIPPDEIIEFKEAIVFAFLGVLRIRHEANCLRSVTGARADSVGGAIYDPAL